MGSGTYLHRAYRKYGIENFKKEILRVCKTREDVSDLERWIVTEELVKNPRCYNQRVGGDDSDSFYGKISCVDLFTRKNCKISKSEFYGNLERYQSIGKGLVTVRYKGIEGRYFKVTSDEYWSNRGMYETISKGDNMKGKMPVINPKTGKYEIIYKNDPRYLSGELVPIWTGKSHSKSSKDKISRSLSKNQKGSGNSMYGKTIVNNGIFNKSVKLDELDEFLNNNPEWKRGKLFSEEGRKNIRKSRSSRSLSIIYSFNELDNLRRILMTLPNPKKMNYTNGYENIKITESDIEYYESKGYWRGVTQFNGHKNHNPNSGFKNYAWINNGIINKCIRKEELDKYLSTKNWNRGRVRKKK